MYTLIMYSRCAKLSSAIMIPQRKHLNVALARSLAGSLRSLAHFHLLNATPKHSTRAKLTNRNILYIEKNESACSHGQVALVL
jgi:hypothetical protein